MVGIVGGCSADSDVINEFLNLLFVGAFCTRTVWLSSSLVFVVIVKFFIVVKFIMFPLSVPRFAQSCERVWNVNIRHIQTERLLTWAISPRTYFTNADNVKRDDPYQQVR